MSHELRSRQTVMLQPLQKLTANPGVAVPATVNLESRLQHSSCCNAMVLRSSYVMLPAGVSDTGPVSLDARPLGNLQKAWSACCPSQSCLQPQHASLRKHHSPPAQQDVTTLFSPLLLRSMLSSTSSAPHQRIPQILICPLRVTQSLLARYRRTRAHVFGPQRKWLQSTGFRYCGCFQLAALALHACKYVCWDGATTGCLVCCICFGHPKALASTGTSRRQPRQQAFAASTAPVLAATKFGQYSISTLPSNCVVTWACNRPLNACGVDLE